MPTFHHQLALDYLQARSLADRTPDALQAIVEHIGQAYVLSADAQQILLAEVQPLAQARGLLPSSHAPMRLRTIFAYIAAHYVDFPNFDGRTVAQVYAALPPQDPRLATFEGLRALLHALPALDKPPGLDATPPA